MFTEINVYAVTSIIIREKNIQSVIAGDIEEYQWEIEKRPLSADNGSIHELILDDDLKLGCDLKQCYVSVHKGFDLNEMKKCTMCSTVGKGSKKCKTSEDKVKNSKTMEKENKNCKTENEVKNGNRKKEQNKIDLENDVSFKGKRNKKQKRCCLSCCLGFPDTKKSKKH